MPPADAADPRDEFSGRRELAFRVYVAAVALIGLTLLALTARDLSLGVVLALEPAFWMVAVFLLVAELRPLFTAGDRDPNGLALSTSFLFALLLRYGLPVAVVVQAVAIAVGDVSRGRAPWRTAFNVGQYTLAWSAAAAVMGTMGFSPTPEAPVEMLSRDLLAALVGGLTYFVVNQLLVSCAVALKVGRPVWRLLWDDLPQESVTNGALLTLAPLVVLVVEEGPWFLPLLAPPLVAVYLVASVALVRERQAMTDSLTGLPNRKMLVSRTNETLSAGTADDGVALLLLDLDRFKEVNDTLGHHVGDRLLRVVADRLTGAVRPGDTVARLGGDEFAVLLPATCAAEAEEVALRLLAAVAAPIELEGLLVDVGSSAGLALYPAHGDDLDTLLQHADVAMYLAKETSSGVETYDAGRDRNSTGRLVLLGELRRAIGSDELVLHYQPKADLTTGCIVGVEALVRWQHPDRGLVPPDEFIPLAESSGLIQALTAHVIDVGVRQAAQWRDAGLEVQVAINVSVRDLCGGRLADHVSATLDRYGVPGRLLLLEVTEGSLFADPRRAADTLRALGEMGVTLSLDDFGTGYSSLGQLRQLPVREMKIDRSFVQRVGSDRRDAAIVRGVVDLADGLGMHVVAEGVEDEQTWRQLQEMGCHSGQGWHLSRPQPADVLTDWLRERVLGAPYPAPDALAER